MMEPNRILLLRPKIFWADSGAETLTEALLSAFQLLQPLACYHIDRADLRRPKRAGRRRQNRFADAHIDKPLISCR